MKKFLLYMLIAITGNALGTALMDLSNLGLTAWGSASKNVAVYYDVYLGTAFVILSVIFYTIACLIRKRFDFKELIFSSIALFAFGGLTNFFIEILPPLDATLFIRVILNIFGLLILLFAIAVHIKLNVALQPMDVYLRETQKKVNSIVLGTFITYLSAFLTALIFGLLEGEINGIGFGTILTLTASGFILRFYNKYILSKWTF